MSETVKKAADAAAALVRAFLAAARMSIWY